MILALTACTSASSGQTDDSAKTFLASQTGLSSSDISVASSLNGFQRTTSVLIEVTVAPGYTISNPSTFVASLMKTGWSVTDHEPNRGLTVSVSGSSVDLTAAAGANGGTMSSLLGQPVVNESHKAAQKHFGSWPGTPPTKIAGISAN